MVQRRSFTTATDSDEPVVFDINGIEFQCRPQISAGIVLKMGELLGGDEDTLAEDKIPVKEMIGVIREFFDHALKPEDRHRFKALLDDPDTPIPLQTLIDIASWLAGVYVGNRPTGQNSPPTSASESRGDVSTGSASPEELTSGPYLQTVPTT